ncbi:MAG: histidinol dehydrogenase [candidate division NC10 bacterium]|nr:histidinol dehydrogenase [candidate division NC10 bacterium]
MMRVVQTQGPEFSECLNRLTRRGERGQEEVEAEVRSILAEVRRRKDQALLEFCERFDGCRLSASQMRVPASEVQAAYQQVSSSELSALRKAQERIFAFHARKKPNSWMVLEEGGFLGQIEQPLRRVGIYVPGGKASYPSSVLMNAIPARVAGVEEVAMCTPAARDLSVSPWVLVAADLVGVQEIYRVGGAQAIAALAYGTESIAAVDKIVGPGNLYVATAKRLVYGEVDIDMVAGPSEVLIYAEEGAEPALLAADLLSQAEHDEMAFPLLLTPSLRLAEEVREEVERQAQQLPRLSIVRSCLRRNGWILVCRDRREATALINEIAPEHLELMVEAPWEMVGSIRNAGALFLGASSPEAIGDYLAGPNHVLPTGGTARFSSPLGVEDFLKRSSVIALSRERLAELGGVAVELARLEGLEGHARAVERRTKR